MAYLTGCWFCAPDLATLRESHQVAAPDGPVCDACHRRLERFRAWLTTG